MKKNYYPLEDIEAELKKVVLENFLDFNSNDAFEFAKCEGCDGPLLGHLEVKCTVKEEVRYGLEIVKTFKNWLKRIPGFREQLKARQQQRENMRATAIGEYVKLAIESAEKKNTPGGTINMASWTHNANINVLGYSPLQLVTGKSIVLPGLNNRCVVME